MNYGAEPADQVVRYSLEGTEVALRLSGRAAVTFAKFVAAVLQDQKKTHGKTRLVRLLREGKPLKFFSVEKERMREFAHEAKMHGLLFVPMRNKTDPDHIEIAILADDASNPCDAVTLPSGEKPEIAALTNEQQRALVQISYRHRYGVFVRLDLSTGLRMGELLALRWEDIDLVGAQLTVKRTINRLARYEQDEGKHSTEIVFDTPKTQNACRTIPLTRSVIEDLKRWRSIQLADQNAAGAAYQDTGFVVTNELGMYFEQRTFKDYYNRMLQDAGIGHFTFHALRHTFATRALERGMDYKTLSAILGHYSVSFTMDTYVHSMDEHKRNEMDKMDDLFGISLEISVEQQPYPVLFTVTEEGCKAFAPDFPKIQIQAGTMETALMEAKKQIQKALSQFKYPPIPTRQEDIVVPENSVLILLKTA